MNGPHPARRAPTLDDVARRAGVSLATASRALNGSTRIVADSYRDRVLAAAHELGYAPNLLAQATARGSARIVSLVVADIADPYFGQIAAGVTAAAAAEGLHVMVAVAGRDPRQEEDLLHVLRGQRPRAVILAGSRFGSEPAPGLRREVEALTDAGCTVVALGSGDVGMRALPVANEEGARLLARALRARGYDRAVVLGAAEGLRTSDDRVRGFAAGFVPGGGEIDLHRGGFTRDDGERMMRAVLESDPAPGTVVFGANDVVAIGAAAAIRAAAREVGADLGVAGFDDIPMARDVTPGLTTVRIPLEDIGAAALRLALAEDSAPPSAAPAEVVLRGSTPDRR
ncbi:LacI family transcriptional regulator [Microbacterium sp. cx-55]|uniref:LacI family DNA-binding transcriptional regulator n=1 Tax=Microbacterium sp. cx-55 TaxID=2875948 RepID=UPI001CBDCEC1|nr:LacI family DNA-binding transcriptional regulator [Microbacterium sp. cx-55]MBZ4487498.1 LacI family transcriptional regulator [Microbacterium sp. cx-55]UGB35518.1 LacI family transcriptional regulator [Microbacterium sp. cx-55]